MSEFRKLLRVYREARGYSTIKLGEKVGIDPSYISRMELGKRNAPRPAVIEALARGLKLRKDERDGFYLAAGYVPPSLTRTGWGEAVASVVHMLDPVTLEADERSVFSQTIQTIASRWRQ